MTADPEFSIIVPGYDEEHSIADTIGNIRSVMRRANLSSYELVIVNDGSRDGTREVLEKLKQADTSLLVIHHEFNRGYGAALKTGIRASHGWLIAITDADGTYPNDRLPDLIELCADGARTSDNVTYSRLRMIPKVFLRAYASWIARTTIPDLNSGLRVFRRDLVEKYLSILPDGFSFTTTITLALLTNNYRVTFEPIDYFERIGQSKIKPIRDTLKFIQLIARTGMYFAPARVLFPVLLATGLSAILSLGYDLFVLDDLTDKSVILVMFTMNTAMFAMLADMLDKRT